jgi:nucleotide-binding universal stress UspA family protein
MPSHLLIPLDGSSLAEAALPVAETLARCLPARMTLLHLLEANPAESIHGDKHLTDPDEANAYLAELRRTKLPADLDVALHVHDSRISDVAAGIVAHQAELHPDLIVMCTHGPAGLDRIMRGSLAQQVVGLGETPLLLVRPELLPRGEPYRLGQILVALDGRPEHEGGLTWALLLARASSCQLHLLSVIPNVLSLAGKQATISRFLPGTIFKLRDIAANQLRDYLKIHLGHVRETGIFATAEVCDGKIPERIVTAANDQNADLIVMATHGKAGTQAFWDNSVAVDVQSRTVRPLLLVPL